MKTLISLFCFLSLLVAGCSKEPAATSTATQPTNAAAAKTNAAVQLPPPSGNYSSGNPVMAPVNYLGAIAAAKKSAEKTIDSVALNQLVQQFYAQEGRYPKDMDELVKENYLPRIPPPPYGMKYVYNPTTGELKVVRP